MVIYSGFTHQKWWFSIAMLNYQRVMGKWCLRPFHSPFHVSKNTNAARNIKTTMVFFPTPFGLELGNFTCKRWHPSVWLILVAALKALTNIEGNVAGKPMCLMVVRYLLALKQPRWHTWIQLKYLYYVSPSLLNHTREIIYPAKHPRCTILVLMSLFFVGSKKFVFTQHFHALLDNLHI